MNRTVAVAALTAALIAGCNESAVQQAPDAGTPIAGLSAEQAARVVAKVGDRAITLGDFAKTLERMDQFDRLRYQTKERRRELLNEIINVELLASEAKRRGLDKDPEAEDQVRTILRDAMLAQTREGIPSPAQITNEEVRAYYEANADKFHEPERRRVAAIVVADKKEAQKILKDALKLKNAAEWGELFFKSSITAPKTRGANSPVELAGDLGIVGGTDDPKGANVKVPEAVRAAVFKIASVGGIGADVVEADGKQFIVRMNGITAAHHRTLAEADRSIRVLLVQDKMQQKERALEDELRKKFVVQIDEQALAGVKMPAGMDRWYAMDSAMWPQAEEVMLDGGAAEPSTSTSTSTAPDAGAARDAGSADAAPPVQVPGKVHARDGGH